MSLTILEKIDKFFNPWKYDNEAFETIEAYKTPRNRTIGIAAQEIVDSDILGINLEVQKEPFDVVQAINVLAKEPPDNGLYYHDLDVHQVAVKFKPLSFKRYQARSDKARRKLKPILYPKVESYDKTHVIPVGYHGSENDIRLLVGWDRKQNQQDMRLFEDDIKKINKKKGFIWYTSITLQNQSDFSAIWKTTIVDETGEILLEKTFHDTSSFKWT